MSNAYATYPLFRDSLPKGGLIPDGSFERHLDNDKDLLIKDGHAWH